MPTSAGCCLGNQLVEVLIEPVDLIAELLITTGNRPERQLRRRGWRGQFCTRTEGSRSREESSDILSRRSRARNASGEVTTRACSSLAACVRALIAD